MLRLCMSGAGVAFPVQLISSPRHSVSILCYSSALHCTSSPQLCPASPLLCSPCPCLSVPIRRVAVPGQAWRFPCKSWHIHASPMHVRGRRSFSGALRVQALPQLCFSRRILSFAGPSFSGAERRAAIPGHFIALHCPALSSLSERCQSHVLLCPRAAGPVKSLRFRRLSVRLLRRLSARTIACAVQSLVKNCPTQPSALRGRPFAQGAGWLIMVRMRWRSASGFSVPCSTTTSS